MHSKDSMNLTKQELISTTGASLIDSAKQWGQNTYSDTKETRPAIFSSPEYINDEINLLRFRAIQEGAIAENEALVRAICHWFVSNISVEGLAEIFEDALRVYTFYADRPVFQSLPSPSLEVIRASNLGSITRPPLVIEAE